VERIPLEEALKKLDPASVKKFFKTTLPTNFVKFPFFEAVNVIMSNVDVAQPELRGALTGAVFTTATLPITNFRYAKSMGKDINPQQLYQAYVPTVLRDIVYGIARARVTGMLVSRDPAFAKTAMGRFLNMFLTVIAACVISAPGNEYRGYCLQPPDRKLPFSEFFKPEKFVRSTTTGALVMGTALGVGALVTPKVEDVYRKVRGVLDSQPIGYVLLVLFALHQHYANQRHAEAMQKRH
jgi:hypothetical protein